MMNFVRTRLTATGATDAGWPRLGNGFVYAG